jgi:Uncharacterized conserved protein
MSNASKMEIEYKFGISNDETFLFLSSLEQVGAYILKDKSHPLFTDIFYDTPDFLLFSVGFYLRKRLEAGTKTAVWTLKQSDASAEEVHKRSETIQMLPKDSQVKDITDPEFKKKLSLLLGDLTLVPVLTLEQDRIFKTVFKAGLNNENSDLTDPANKLADLSIDLVGQTFSDQKHSFTELEIELSGGTENELKEFIAELKTIQNLKETLYFNRFSKFERGLILYFNRDKIEGTLTSGIEKRVRLEEDFETDENAGDIKYDLAESGFLRPSEKAALMQISEKSYTVDPTDYFGNTGFLKPKLSANYEIKNKILLFEKALILSALDGGMSTGFAAQSFDMTPAEIEEIRYSFELNRMELFPISLDVPADSKYCLQKPPNDGKVWTIEELAKYYGIQPPLPSLIQKEAFLFDMFGKENSLSEREKHALNAAVRLNGIGEGISIQKNVNTAAEIILTHPIDGFSLNEIKMTALIFVLRQIKNPTPSKIRAAVKNAGFFVPPAFQKKALLLTALFELITNTENELKSREKQAGFAEYVLGVTGTDILILPTESERETAESERESADEKSDKLKLKINSNDMMAVAAEKIFAAQLNEVKKAEPGVIDEKDIEDVHDMRVALRKMRSANIIFRDFLDSEWLMKTEAGLKATLSALGVIRDLDVVLEKTNDWMSVEKIDAPKMSVFYEFVKADRKNHHAEAVRYLMSAEYTDFRKELEETFESGVYLGKPNINKKGDTAPIRICDVLPAILHEKAADITAYHEWLDGPYIYTDKLHRLRIAAKNFRYTLDFFKECLGEAAVSLIKEFKELQDILGDFHDAVVAVDVIESYLKRIQAAGEEINSKSDQNRLLEILMTADTLGRYKSYREAEADVLLETFHVKWTKMNRRFFTEKISKIIEEANFE